MKSELWWKKILLQWTLGDAEISLGMHPANDRHRYIVTMSLIGWVHT